MAKTKRREGVREVALRPRRGADGIDRPVGRGGKSPDPLGDDERVATEHGRDVMVPADEASTFVVVETEIALSSS